MRPRPRLRKTAKWAGAVVSIMGAGALAYSWRWSAGVYWTPEHPDRFVEKWFAIRNGCVEYERIGFRGDGHSPQFCQFTYGPNEGPVVWTPSVRVDELYLDLLIPLWIPFPLLAIPAALLWRRDHVLSERAKSGRCPKCGYDRRGLVGGTKCPECGMVPTK